MAHVRTQKRADGAKRYEVRWRQAGTFKHRTFTVKRNGERFALRMEDEIERGQSTEVYLRRGTTVRDVAIRRQTQALASSGSATPDLGSEWMSKAATVGA